MAKMTISDLKTFAAGYVDASKQAGSWSGTTNNLYGLVDKIGKIITLKGEFSDKLPELEGDELPFGKTIEETMIDLVLPTVYGDGVSGHVQGIANEVNATAEGAKDVAPAYPSIESAAYSYTLGRVKTKITRPYDFIEAGCQNAEQVGELTGDIMWALESSMSLTRYNLKKYLLGNAISKAVTANLYENIAIPVDTDTAEAFIKQVKEDVEEASFAGEGKSLSGALIGASPRLVLYVKKGVMPVVEVDALAGAFHAENLAIPAEIKVVDDFGGANANVWALLVDPRGIKLHNSYRAIRSKENADGDFVNFVEHEENTGFISKHVFMKVYKVASN